MQLATLEAQKLNHEYVGTEHLLIGLVKEGSGVAANVLKNLGVELAEVRTKVEGKTQAGPDSTFTGKLPHTPRTKKVIEYAIESSNELGHNYVGTEHLLLGLLREQGGVAFDVMVEILREKDLEIDNVREEVLNLLGVNAQADDGEYYHELLREIKKVIVDGEFETLVKISRLLKDV